MHLNSNNTCEAKDMENAKSVGSLPPQALLAVVWTSFSVACLLVILRTAIRLKYMPRLTMEDYWIFLALTTLLTSCILQTIQQSNLYFMLATIAGIIPISDNLIASVENYLRFEFPINILFWTVLWCVKASFLALYFKLFRELPSYRRVWYFLAAFTFCAYVGCWITLATSCHPISNFFKFEQCNSKKDIWASRLSIYYSTAVDIFTDLCSECTPNRFLNAADPISSDGHAYQVDLQPANIHEAEGRARVCFQPVLCHDRLRHHSSKTGSDGAIFCESRPS